MAITKFGQYLKITIKDEANSIILEADDLRVDFDIRDLRGFSRAKFTLYNLKPETIKSIANGTNFVSLKVRLHDGALHTIADSMYVSNSLDVVQVPDGITYIYAYSNLRRLYLEKQIQDTVYGQTLEGVIKRVESLAGVEIKTYNFPKTKLTSSPPGGLLNTYRLLGL